MFAVLLVRYWSGIPLALGVRLTIAGVPAVSLWLWYGVRDFENQPEG